MATARRDYGDGYGWKAWYGLWECQATTEACEAERQVVEAVRNGRAPIAVSEWDDYASIWECAVTDAWDPVECVLRAQRRATPPKPATKEPKRRAPRRRKRWLPVCRFCLDMHEPRYLCDAAAAVLAAS